MSAPPLNFQYKIDSIRARPDATPQVFTNGFYKPPVETHDYEQVHTTGWCQWTTSGAPVPATSAPSAQRVYSTSVFYDGIYTSRFLYHGTDCRTQSISIIENQYGEGYGWQQLSFTQIEDNHCALVHNGERDSLCGKGGTYTPRFLPQCYRSQHSNTLCGLSGNMSLFLALTAFSCNPGRMRQAIHLRLDLTNRRWQNGNLDYWGEGRIHGRGLVVHIRGDENLAGWENGNYGPLLC